MIVDVGAIGDVSGVLIAIGIGEGEGRCMSGICIRNGVRGGALACCCASFLKVL